MSHHLKALDALSFIRSAQRPDREMVSAAIAKDGLTGGCPRLLSDHEVWSRFLGHDMQVPLRLTIAMLMLDIGTEWTLNALSTTSNS